MHTDAPEGFEWKHVKLPRSRMVYPNNWRQAKFLSVDMHEAIIAVLVKAGTPAMRKVALENTDSVQ